MAQEGQAVVVLPPLQGEQSEWHLPLSEWGATFLEAALLAHPREEGRAALWRAIANDASLAAWISCAALLAGHPLPPTCGAATAWCWPRLPQRLAGCRLQPRPSDWPAVTRRLAEARRAAEAALRADTSPAGQVMHFSTLLEIMPQWLKLANFADATRTEDEENMAGQWREAARLRITAQRPDDPSDDDIGPIVEQPPPAVEERLVSLVRQRLPDDLRREAFDQQLEIAKLAALKELAYGASHEINNPLANISARAQSLHKDEHDAERRRMLLAIQSQAMRAHEMISDLMLFARPPDLDCEEFDLAPLVKSVVDDMQVDAKDQQTSLDCFLPTGTANVNADRRQLEVALVALLRNALEALGGGGQVVVRLVKPSHRAASPLPTSLGNDQGETGEGWNIVVTDNGPGMSQRVRRHLFDPFFSGREAGRGLGFGLSKCWRIAHQHGGSISVDSRLGWGTTIIFSLPALATAAATRPLAATRVC